MIIKLSNFFRKIYIYIISKFEICVVIQKVIIVNLLLIIFKILIKILKVIIFISFKITVFIFFKRYYRYNYHNHRRNSLITIHIYIINHYYQTLNLKMIFTSIIIDRIYTYIIRNISFNRNIILIYIY